MDGEKIGNLIKQIRKDNNLTQEALANILGVTYQAVSKWENNKNIPDIGIIKLICEKFNLDINEFLNGNKKSKRYIYLIIIGIVIILLIIGFMIFHHDSFEFKTLSTTCKEFEINGSAAYNKDKSSLYISNIEYCGKENNEVYESITCTLYEKYNNYEVSVNDCKKEYNITLEKYLKNLKIKVDNYNAVCKKFSNSNMYLEISATDKSEKTTIYTIPLTMKDEC